MDFIDLKAQYSQVETAVRKRIDAVLEHGHYIMGPEVAELEQVLAHRIGAKHCISCASGSDALLMPLLAWNIGPGDAVFVPSFTFFATAEMVSLLGATPVFVDVDLRTFNMQPAALGKAIEAVRQQDASLYPLPAIAVRQALTPRAVIPVDLFGIAADYAALLPIAQQHKLLVLEDAAQSFGGQRDGKDVANMHCHAASTSFFPAKPLGCYGDGGAIFTNDDALASLLRSIRVHGKGADKYENIRIGLNGRLDTLQAAILLAKLEVFDAEIAARHAAAAQYTALLQNIPGLITPHLPAGCRSVYAQYSLLVDAARRDSVCAHLQRQNIPTNIYYPKPLHMQAVFAPLDYNAEDMPISLELSQRIFSVPFHPYLTEADIIKVCKALQEALV